MNIEDQRVVKIHYILKDDVGDIIDSSEGKEPLPYIHGTGALIPGLERELAGRAAGEEFEVTIEPEEGYGELDPELVQAVDRSVVGDIEGLQPGMQLEARDPDGHVRYVIVREVSEETVVLDANPPLAGRTLHFKVTIDSIREATAEELEHGHAH